MPSIAAYFVIGQCSECYEFIFDDRRRVKVQGESASEPFQRRTAGWAGRPGIYKLRSKRGRLLVSFWYLGSCTFYYIPMVRNQSSLLQSHYV